MRARAASWVAWSLCALTLALIACAVALSVLNSYDLRELAFLIAEAAAALVGGLVASRRPSNPVGWLIAGHALCFTVGEFTRQYAIYGVLTQPGALPAARAFAWPTYWIWIPGLILMLSFLPLYFPDGRLVSPRWLPIAWLAVFVAVVAAGFTAFDPSEEETPGIPNPLGIEGLQTFSGSIVIPVLWLGVVSASAVSLVVRFRRSRGEERQQVKWFTYAVALAIPYLAVNIFFLQAFAPAASSVLPAVPFMSLWITIGIAILRYRLYDIDLLINRTLVYGTITAVYVGGVVLLQTLLRVSTGQESQFAIVASTLAIAALFGPLRRRVQAFIDRRFYRKKYDAAKTLEAFGARLRDETDLDELSEDLVGVVRETMQPAHVSLWLHTPTGRDGGVTKGREEP